MGIAMLGKRERQQWDWLQLRDWSVQNLQLFLDHADSLNSKEGWTRYREASMQLPEFHWNDIKDHSNDIERDILSRVTSALFELPDIVALHGEFSDMINAAQQWVDLLKNCEDPSSIYQFFCEIDDSF